MPKQGMDLADQLRQAIQKSGRSLTELGAACGIDSARMSRFMRGDRGLSLEAFTQLAQVLGLELKTGDTKEPEASAAWPLGRRPPQASPSKPASKSRKIGRSQRK